MSEPKTAWDLASRFGQIVVGEERWDVGIGVAFVMHGDEAEMLTNNLSAIPADAVEQIKTLRAEVGELLIKLDATRADAARELERARIPITL